MTLTPLSNPPVAHRRLSLFALIAAVGFVLLYPAFFFYHFMVGKFGMPSFLAGFYGPVTLALAPLAAIALFLRGRCLLRSAPGVLFIALWSYSAFWVAINGYIFPDNFISEEMNAQYLTVLISWIALFFVGMFVPFSSRKFTNIIMMCWAAICLIVISNINTSYAVFTYNDSSSSVVASYQGMSRGFFIISLYLIAVMPKRAVVLSVASTVVLFLVGARSELAAFVFALAALLILHVRRRPLVSFAIGAAALGVLIQSVAFAQLNTSSRQLGLLQLGGDSSWNARQDMMNFAMQQIYENPLGGVYAGHYLYSYSNLGSGAHNIISAWTAFGFIGFVLYAAIVLASFLISWRMVVSKSSDPRRVFYFIMASSAVVLVLFSKDVFWGEAALVWGGVCSLAMTHEITPRRQGGARPRGFAREAAAGSRQGIRQHKNSAPSFVVNSSDDGLGSRGFAPVET